VDREPPNNEHESSNSKNGPDGRHRVPIAKKVPRNKYKMKTVIKRALDAKPSGKNIAAMGKGKQLIAKICQSYVQKKRDKEHREQLESRPSMMGQAPGSGAADMVSTVGTKSMLPHQSQASGSTALQSGTQERGGALPNVDARPGSGAKTAETAPLQTEPMDLTIPLARTEFATEEDMAAVFDDLSFLEDGGREYVDLSAIQPQQLEETQTTAPTKPASETPSQPRYESGGQAPYKKMNS
jgi:hypothetical protein